MDIVTPYSINLGGKLVELTEPQVMGILNVTPDSFYADSRKQTEEAIANRVQQIVAEGALIVDVGACSTRPGGELADGVEECRRLKFALEIIRREVPDAILSVDTFRADVAKMAVEEYGVAIINDISGGTDEDMFPMVARLGVPYVLTHNGPLGNSIGEMMHTLSIAIGKLAELGQKDIIIDPGFGFGKSMDENYQVLAHLDELRAMGMPILVGVSRKRMAYQLLGTTPQEALNGTSVLHTLALERGAHLLRVHDVAAANEVIKIVKQCSCHSA